MNQHRQTDPFAPQNRRAPQAGQRAPRPRRAPQGGTPQRRGPAPRDNGYPAQGPRRAGERVQGRPQAGPGPAHPAPRPRRGGNPPPRRPMPPQERDLAAPAGRRVRRQGQSEPPKKKSGGVPRWVLIVLDVLIVAIICVAAYYIWRPIHDERNADEFKEELLAQVDRDKKPFQAQIPRNFGLVQGEQHENLGEQFVDNNEDFNDTDTVTLNYVGKLSIPKINVVTPLSYDQGNELLVSLRFGSGIHSGSAFANIGEPGLTTIWGHRFLTSGKDFNRLDEIVPGDQFYIDYLPTGKRYYYNVYDQVIINQDELDSYVYQPYDEDVVVLITCHPPVYNAQLERLLVFAKPDNERTIDIP